MEDDCFKIGFFDKIVYGAMDVFDNWVYPAYHLRNFLFGRYDIVKLNKIRRTCYCDVDERMLQANMELICFFIEKENPEKYICWYDEDDYIGERYGAHCDDVLFPEYKGRYVMDMIKEIYHWWTMEAPTKEKEINYLLSFWHKYVGGRMKEMPDVSDNGLVRLVFDDTECPRSLDELEGKEIDWAIIDKYVDGDRNNVFKENFISSKMTKARNDLFYEKQRYLHLCIEVRPYLFT